MASLNRACAVNKCEISSCAICHCCQKDLCLDHIREHKEQLNAKLNPLVHQINTLLDNLEHFTPNLQTLEQWRTDAHATVERFVERICEDLFERRKNETRNKVCLVRTNLDQLIRKQASNQENIDVLTKDLRGIEQEMDRLVNAQINLRPLVINENEIMPNNSSNRSARENQSAQATAGPQNQQSFQIFIESVTQGKMLIMAEPSNTILEVKRTIQDRQGTPIENQSLSFMGKQLMDHHTLATYGIQNLFTLRLNDFYRKK